MADIDVQRKGPSIWPWIIGLIILALLIWALAELLGDDGDLVEEPVAEVVEPVPAAEEPVAAAMPLAVTDYTESCVDGAQPAEMGLEHEFTTNCIQQMVVALDAVIERDNIAGADVEQRLDDFRQVNQRLEASDPEALTHADMTREVFTSAADLMNAVYQTGYSGVAGLGGEIEQASSAAQAVQPGVPMLEQRDAVQNFFRMAGNAIRMMAETPAVM